MGWKATIQKNDWRNSALSLVPPKPVSKKDIVQEIMQEVSPSISWKNTLSIVPKNGRDGRDGKDGKQGKPGKSIVGPQGPAGKDGLNGKNGIDGKDGLNGATWHLVTEKPDDIGNDGDFSFNKKSFEIYHKESGSWTLLGSVKGKDKTGYVGGLNGTNGLSAYEIAVKNGYVGTEVEWLESLGSARVELAQIVDEASDTVTYIGKAQPGTAESSAAWQIKKITISGTETITTFADGNADFDKIWNNRASLSYL